MTYTRAATCTYCGGPHQRGQCPWSLIYKTDFSK
jgi:hypothetical protein